MKDAIRSLLAAAGIVVCSVGVLAGIGMRNRVDLQSSNLAAERGNHASLLNDWLASRDDETVNVSAADYYSQIEALLKQYYIEPITDEQKLASGSVRGMVSSLDDPRSVFLDAAHFKALIQRQQGEFQGIGVDLTLQEPPVASASAVAKTHKLGEPEPPVEDAQDALARMPKVPRVVVTAVVAGGPADKAGVQVGDQVADIDGHWVIEQSLIDRFRTAQKLLLEGKIQFSAIAPLQRELKKKTERALLPMAAKERLLLGTTGVVTVDWLRHGVSRTTRIARAFSHMPSFDVAGDVVRLPMNLDAVAKLRSALKGRSNVVIDLRNDPEGDDNSIEPALRALVPSGAYGDFVTSRDDPPTPLQISRGNPNPPKITLLVDQSTNGPAAILAAALSSHGRAVLRGSETGKDLSVIQAVELADGAGYTLVTGDYRSKAPKHGFVAVAEARR